SAKIPIGFIKVGKKKLFLFNAYGECFEVEPVCVLDFFVSAVYQRQGYGKELFEWMLREEGLVATDLPIDSPSPKMLSFMKKHYNQDHPIRQSNNFVVFPDFFLHASLFEVPRHRSSRGSLPSSLSVSLHSSRISNPPAQTVEAKYPPFSSSPIQTQCRTSLPPCATPGFESQIESTKTENVFRTPNIQKALNTPSVQTPIPQLRSRDESGFLRDGPALRYSKRIIATNPTMLFRGSTPVSSSEINTLRRLNERQTGYEHKRTAWANNRHTRLW
ncbi:unnamed protein product, partial [Hydatigera taeniaeformis]|uniref:N-acetyltransferase domain-containing protein n=1 Tax=Hydatigena taeniaeformis TaxID=6205 RepID=A0A0R3X436_HYDTA